MKKKFNRINRVKEKRHLAELIEEYDIKTDIDIQEALNDLLGSTIQEMLETELSEHLKLQMQR